MPYTTRKNAWQDELWNVSLLPAVKVRAAEPPSGPLDGGTALASPALLSASEGPSQLRQAA
jgi:hypothetical protein